VRGGESGGAEKRGVAEYGVGRLEKGGGRGDSRAWQLSSAHVARWGPMVGSAAPSSRARRRVNEPLCHVLSLKSKRRAVGSPRVAFLAARRYFLLQSAWPLCRGEGGGVAGGEDGRRRWGGWRRRRPAWLAARPQPTFAAERKG